MSDSRTNTKENTSREEIPAGTDALTAARAEIDDADGAARDAFACRMRAVGAVAAYKATAGLPVYDPAREKEMLARNVAHWQDPALIPHYTSLLRHTVALSREYQEGVLAREAGICRIPIGEPAEGCDILFGRGLLARAGKWLPLRNGKTLILTDDGVPASYAESIRRAAGDGYLLTLPAGESVKSFPRLEEVCRFLCDHGFDRGDALVTVGGGTVCDLGGFAAAVYMRGIRYYSVPTTLLAMADAGIGGKCAVDFSGIKNTLGVFYPARRVLIDPALTATLPPRQFSSGMAEVIKVALTSDEALFCRIENGLSADEDLDHITEVAVRIKANIVTQDPKEGNIRKVLNFGHTLGHAIESAGGLGDLLHGECVALGMIPMTAPEIRGRLLHVLKKYGLPTDYETRVRTAVPYLLHDKKRHGEFLDCVYVPAIGQSEIRRMKVPDVIRHLHREAGLTPPAAL